MVSSVIELLLETLVSLNAQELKNFRKCLHQIVHHKSHSDKILRKTKLQDTVFSIVLSCGQGSVEKTKEILGEMQRTDQVQMLSAKSSEFNSKDKIYLRDVINV